MKIQLLIKKHFFILILLFFVFFNFSCGFYMKFDVLEYTDKNNFAEVKTIFSFYYLNKDYYSKENTRINLMLYNPENHKDYRFYFNSGTSSKFVSVEIDPGFYHVVYSVSDGDGDKKNILDYSEITIRKKLVNIYPNIISTSNVEDTLESKAINQENLTNDEIKILNSICFSKNFERLIKRGLVYSNTYVNQKNMNNKIDLTLSKNNEIIKNIYVSKSKNFRTHEGIDMERYRYQSKNGKFIIEMINEYKKLYKNKKINPYSYYENMEYTKINNKLSINYNKSSNFPNQTILRIELSDEYKNSLSSNISNIYMLINLYGRNCDLESLSNYNFNINKYFTNELIERIINDSIRYQDYKTFTYQKSKRDLITFTILSDRRTK